MVLFSFFSGWLLAILDVLGFGLWYWSRRRRKEREKNWNLCFLHAHQRKEGMEFKEPEPVKRVPVVPTLPIASATTGSPRKLYVKSDNMLLGRNNLSRSNMPSPTKKRPLPQGTSLYSPRWIVSV